ncbi:MAG: GNAT family N-acetyltransferase [Pseudomonadales bacterium]
MSEAEVLVRPAVSNDADALFELLKELVITYEPERAAFDRSLPRLIDLEHEVLMVAEVNGAVVGYALAAESLTLYANGPVVDLLELVVAESRRGRGIGEELVSAVKAWGSDRGCIDVNVASGRSGGYYERLGFSEAATFYRLHLPDSRAEA